MLIEEFELDIGGRQVFVRPSLDLARRLESAVGALKPFATRLEIGDVTYSEAARMFNALVRETTGGPDAKAVDAWLFEQGLLRHKAVAIFVYSLTIGSATLEAEFTRLQASVTNAARRDGGSVPGGPFAPTAASTAAS